MTLKTIAGLTDVLLVKLVLTSPGHDRKFARGLVIHQQRPPWRIEYHQYPRWCGGFFIQ
jgi:hypothetical protein